MAGYNYVSKKWAICSLCGRKCQPRADGLCSICRQRDKAKRTTGAHHGSRRECHDCGCPTHDYRCEDCWRKLRADLGLSLDVDAAGITDTAAIRL